MNYRSVTGYMWRPGPDPDEIMRWIRKVLPINFLSRIFHPVLSSFDKFIDDVIRNTSLFHDHGLFIF